MTDKQIVEAMAGLDGLKYIDGWNIWEDKNGEIYSERMLPDIDPLPNYLNDHNAVHRVIDGLSNEELCVFDETLNGVTGFKVISYLVWRATPRQKCEAILKAKGLWS